MSQRAAIVEDFDDDTDLPLPSRPLPNTGTRGPLLREIFDSDNDDHEDDLITGNEPTAGPATTSQHQFQFRPSQQDQRIDELDPNHKTWTCIYPIYIDAKQPYGTGVRRISREKSIWWPLSKDIANALQSMRLNAIHEHNKCHPKDWDNPGRVRVEWKRDGRMINPAIKSKKQLLEAIALRIQRLKPADIPKSPYTIASPSPTSAPKPPKSAKSKSKAPTPTPPKKQGGRRLPIPPTPHPPLTSRVSPYSPALPSGMFIEAVKAGMNATEGGAAGAGAAGSPGPGAGMGKGKRKVVRVRG